MPYMYMLKLFKKLHCKAGGWGGLGRARERKGMGFPKQQQVGEDNVW